MVWLRWLLCLLHLLVEANALTISVSTSGGNASSPYQYGIMFEDINHSGDGGIYAELIQNRAFQGSRTFPSTLAPWTAVGRASLALDRTNPLSSALPVSVRVTKGRDSAAVIGLKNPGWWGIDVKANTTYSGSFYARGAYAGNFTMRLQSDITGEELASTTIPSKSRADSWTKHEFQFVPPASAKNSNNSFILQFSPGQGAVMNFNLISLFPPTYNGRPNGNRIDLMQVLKDLNPSFLRFPGGNNLEGDRAGGLWNWSATIGDLTQRPGRAGTWRYQNTDGQGLIEYLNWCKDLGIEPFLAVWGGLYLDGTVVSAAALQPYVQDALNELEFCMGGPETKYGAMRVALGYPEPFPIKFVEVGNEDNLNSGSRSYSSYRFSQFFNAIKAKYPNITVFSSTVEFSPKPRGAGQDYHQYTRPDYLVSQFNFFDQYERGRPTIIGEYAAIQDNSGRVEGPNWNLPRNKFPSWIGAVGEAVFLLGAERNSDRVFGTCYAPLLQNLNSYQWAPDLISFSADPADTTLSTSYHVVRLFSHNRITKTLPATSDGRFGPAYWAVGMDEPSRTYIFKAAVYNSTSTVPFTLKFEGIGAGAQAELTVLTGTRPQAFNAPRTPEVVRRSLSNITAGDGGSFQFSLPGLSVAVLRARLS